MNSVFGTLLLLLAVRRCFVNADCNIVSKKEWDGLTSTHVEYLPRPVDLVIVEHTATPTCSSDESCADIVRSIQNTHMETLNYWDIGYSFLVGGNGKVYEGTGWLHVGAHTIGYNRKSIGIAFIGNFNNDKPTAAAINTLKAMLRCGVEHGHLTSNYKIVAHKQVLSTESPGTNLYNEVKKWPEWVEDINSTDNCNIVSKRNWGGRDATEAETLNTPVSIVIIQHTATPICQSDAECAQSVRNIQNYHMDTLNYGDIGPSFLVGGNGKVYEGSGWHHRGAHTYGYNSKSIGVSFIGDFNVNTPTEKALDAVKKLIKCGVEHGHLSQNYRVVAHKQLVALESPGRKLYNEIRRWPDWLEDVSSIKN